MTRADRHERYWESPPAHTVVKLHILRAYLGAWFGKLGQKFPKVMYIDGFAGRGRYEAGPEGSPLVALDVVAQHSGNLANCDIRMVFIERHHENFVRLQEALNERTSAGIPANITPSVVESDFAGHMDELLRPIEALQGRMPPSFIMIDPFGWSDVSLSLLQRLSERSGRTEVLITFMYQWIVRAARQDNDSLATQLDALYGGREHWIGARDLATADQRREFLVQRYIGRLREIGYRYSFAFQMNNERNVPIYFLLFGSKSIEGLAEMKRAMWKADSTGQYTFSDHLHRRETGQLVLFGGGPDYDDLKRRLISRFGAGEVVTVDKTLREFVLVETPYLDSHYKTTILKPMEKSGQIEIVSSPRKQVGTYPAGTTIRFLSATH